MCICHLNTGTYFQVILSLNNKIKTFETNINNTGRAGVGSKKVIDDAVIVSGDSTKGFAQSFIPLVTYYKALGDTGLINNVKLYS